MNILLRKVFLERRKNMTLLKLQMSSDQSSESQTHSSVMLREVLYGESMWDITVKVQGTGYIQ